MYSQPQLYLCRAIVNSVQYDQSIHKSTIAAAAKWFEWHATFLFFCWNLCTICPYLEEKLTVFRPVRFIQIAFHTHFFFSSALKDFICTPFRWTSGALFERKEDEKICGNVLRTLNAYWTGFPPVCPNADEYSHADKQMHAWNEHAGKTLETDWNTMSCSSASQKLAAFWHSLVFRF